MRPESDTYFPKTTRDQLEAVSNFIHLPNFITAVDGVGRKIASRTSKTRRACSKLWQLWRRHDIRLSIRRRVANLVIRVRYGGPLSIFDHGYIYIYNDEIQARCTLDSNGKTKS